MKEYKFSSQNITKKMKEYLENEKIDLKKSSDIRTFIRSHTIKIDNFHNLIMEIGELAYKNPNVMLFYRGQSKNYTKNKNLLYTVCPTIYRSGEAKEVKANFEILENASNKLLKELEKNEKELDKNEWKEIKFIKLLQYSILQHYEVCSTPLLDVTQSIKVACSFAVLNQDKEKNGKGYIYIFGLPYINGRISINSEEYITNIRLLNISCSISKRPFFQEGYLVQSEFITDEELNFKELDFCNRLIAVYEFENNKDFWGNEVSIDKENLYPKTDLMKDICNNIKKEKYSVISTDSNIVSFLKEWNNFEKFILQKSCQNNLKNGIRKLIIDKKFEKEFKTIDKLRKFRNNLVHNMDGIKDYKLINEMTKKLKHLKKLFKF